MELTPGILDAILNLIQGALNGALPVLEGDTRFLFQSFLIITIVFSGVSYAFGNTSAGLEFLLKKILLVGFALFLVTNWLDLTNIIISSFGLLGLRAGGVSGTALTAEQFFSPSTILTLGFELAEELNQRADEAGSIIGISATSLFLTIAAFFVALAFVIIAAQVFMTLLEFKLVTLGGFILLPFALLDRTTALAQGALGYVISAGLKLFTLAVVVSFAFAIFPTIEIPEEFSISSQITIIATALIFVMLALKAPGLAASMISGGPQLGVGAIAQTAATAVGAGAATGLATAATFRAAGAAGTLAARTKQQVQGLVSGQSSAGGASSVAGTAVRSVAGRSSTSTGTSLVVRSSSTGGSSSGAGGAPAGGGGPSPANSGGGGASVRSELKAAGRDLGRAGVAAGAALPHGDAGGGAASIDLSDRK